MPAGRLITRRGLHKPLFRNLVGPSDTLTDTNGVAIAAHTPTGPNAGTSWTLEAGAFVFQSSALVDNATGVTNRCLFDSLSGDQMDVECEFRYNLDSGSPGVIARGSTTTGIELYYRRNVQLLGLRDSTGSPILEVSAPLPAIGTWFKLRLVCRTGLMLGFMDGDLKVTLATDARSGQTKPGIMIGNFSASAQTASARNFKSQAYS
jgi:hypothetical protein